MSTCAYPSLVSDPAGQKPSSSTRVVLIRPATIRILADVRQVLGAQVADLEEDELACKYKYAGNNGCARLIVAEVKCAVAGNMVVAPLFASEDKVQDWLSCYRLPIELLHRCCSSHTGRKVYTHQLRPGAGRMEELAQVACTASMDPVIFPSPRTFGGRRFLKLRTDRDGAVERSIGNQWDATSAQLHSLYWGYGNRTCPGRFLAVHMIKLLVAVMVVRYDVSNDGGRGVAGRPTNAILDVRVEPDAKARLGFRKLKR